MDQYFISVVFENSRPYYFSTSFDSIKPGEKIVVETIRGVELGTCDKGSKPIEELKSNFELKPIVRIATDKDIKDYEKNLELSKQAFNYCANAIQRFNLDMKLLQAQYVLDRSKITFVYASDNRVDFRDLLKDLAFNLKCRIELRQIGPRDRSKLIGGLGPCGLPLCCATFLENFDGITINMAKNQFLVLNIQKLSGQCGKLSCCLRYENDDYTEIRKTLPKVNSRLNYDGQSYKITSINILTNSVRLENANSIIALNLETVKELLKEQDNGENRE